MPRTACPAAAPSGPRRRALALALALAAASPERGAAQADAQPGAGLWGGLLPAPGPGLAAGAADNDSFLATQLAALEERRQATLATFDTVRDNLLGFLGAASVGPSGGFLPFAPLAAPRSVGPDPATEAGQRLAVAEEAGAEAEEPQPADEASPVGAVCRTYAAEALTQFDSPSPGEIVSTIVVPDKGRLVAAPEVTVDVKHPLAGSARLTLAARWQRKAVRAVLKAFCTKKTGCRQEDARADIAGAVFADAAKEGQLEPVQPLAAFAAAADDAGAGEAARLAARGGSFGKWTLVAKVPGGDAVKKVPALAWSVRLCMDPATLEIASFDDLVTEKQALVAADAVLSQFAVPTFMELPLLDLTGKLASSYGLGLTFAAVKKALKKEATVEYGESAEWPDFSFDIGPIKVPKLVAKALAAYEEHTLPHVAKFYGNLGAFHDAHVAPHVAKAKGAFDAHVAPHAAKAAKAAKGAMDAYSSVFGEYDLPALELPKLKLPSWKLPSLA